MKYLFSRSSASAHHLCPRNGYLRTLAYGHGIESLGVNEHLLQGTIGHDGLARLLKGEDPSLVIPECGLRVRDLLLGNQSWYEDLRSDFREVSAKEWQRLTEGILWAANRFVLPLLLSQYTIVSIEESRIYWFPENPLLGCLAKPDMVLEPREGADVPSGQIYAEWKLCTPDKNWFKQYERNPQSWSGKLAFPDIESFMVIGLDKGTRREGKIHSPFTYLYYLPTEDRWSFETEHKSKKNPWEKISTEFYKGGLEQLVKDLPQSLLEEQFVFTRPIPIDPFLMEVWRKQQLQEQSRYQVIKANQKIDLDKDFPMWLDKCQPGGNQLPCGMLRACHSLGVGRELEGGFYQQRIPHHELELEMIEQGEL